MQRIWLLNHYASEEGRHAFFSRELGRRGYRVTLFASSFLHYTCRETRDYPPRAFFARAEDPGGFERVWVKTPPYRGNELRRLANQLIFALNAFRAGMRMKRERPDVIVGSTVHPFTGLAAYLLARRLKAPFVFEVRDLWPQTLVDLGALPEKGPVTRALRTLEKFLYRRARRIVCLLPGGAHYISARGIPAEKIVHIPNGIDLEWFDRQAAAGLASPVLAKFFEENRDRPVFAYTGAMGPANGVEVLVKAITLLQERILPEGALPRFLLVGEGPEREGLQKMAAALKPGLVTFYGHVGKDEVPAILIRAACCIATIRKSPVHRYGVSMNKLFDYLAAARPLISAVGAEPDLPDAARCGFSVPPDDPLKLAEALKAVAEMTVRERQELGRNGRRYVEKHYDFRVLTGHLVAVLEEAVKDASEQDASRPRRVNSEERAHDQETF